MASMNTRLNIEKLDGNIVQKHEGSKQVGFKQLGPGVETEVHEVHDEKRVWFEVELQGAHGDREAEVFRIHQQNGLVDEINMTLFAKVLQGVKFEVEPQEDHTFEVEPYGNVDHVVEDSNEAAFVVAAMDKIYAHELLTFNNTVACEVIFKWEAGLKDDMDARSDVYVLSNGCKKRSDDSDGYYWEYTPAKGNILGLEIIRDQSSNTLRVSRSRIHNERLVQTFLKGHSTLSLKDSLSGDCDVEKKW
ncbi:hypothetical protein Tco_0321059 [Tanacetum coccineum]